MGVYQRGTRSSTGPPIDTCSSPRLWNISASTGPSATSLLLNTVTGEAMEHWLELDHSGDDPEGNNDYERMLLLWPSKALDAGTQYIVAFRGLIDDSGAPVAPTDGFAALRDKTPTENPAIEASRAHYEALFATLAGKGWTRDASLTLAWPFTTNSKANVTGQFLAMRDDAFARVAKEGFTWKVLEVRRCGCQHARAQCGTVVVPPPLPQVTPPTPTTGKIINGVFRVPLYLSTPEPSLQSRLVLDPATGLPVYQGWCVPQRSPGGPAADLIAHLLTSTSPSPACRHNYEFMIIIPSERRASRRRSGALPSTALPPLLHSPPSPDSVLAKPAPSKVLQYGHGLFGSVTELKVGYLNEEADNHSYILGGVNWIGEEGAPLRTLRRSRCPVTAASPRHAPRRHGRAGRAHHHRHAAGRRGRLCQLCNRPGQVRRQKSAAGQSSPAPV